MVPYSKTCWLCLYGAFSRALRWPHPLTVGIRVSWRMHVNTLSRAARYVTRERGLRSREAPRGRPYWEMANHLLGGTTVKLTRRFYEQTGRCHRSAAQTYLYTYIPLKLIDQSNQICKKKEIKRCNNEVRKNKYTYYNHENANKSNDTKKKYEY